MNKQTGTDTMQVNLKIRGKHFMLNAQLQSPGEFGPIISTLKEKNCDCTVMILDDNLKALWISGLEDITGIAFEE